MAVDLRCPNCEDNLGKDTENSMVAWCGTCGTNVYNDRGDTDDLTDDDKKWLKENKPRSKPYISYTRRW
jgi:Zn-finger nucleic acid-binding protein